MLMFNRLKRRASEPERMDDFSKRGPELTEALRHLRRLNRILGAAYPSLYGVKRLWTDAGRPKRLSVLDIGSGSGEINRILLRWADRNRIDMTIVLADVTEEACEEARRVYMREPRVRVMRCDLFQLPASSADIVTASQFVHHFPSEDLPEIVERMLHASRYGVVVSDIHRHWIPWLAVWLLTRIVSRNVYIRHDAPLSVAKGFRAADWRSLAKHPAVPHMSFAWRPLFRYVALVRKELEQASCDHKADGAGTFGATV